MTQTQPQHLIVTGATGFIGGHLTRAALARGHQVTALVRRPEDLAELRCPGLRVVEWSLAQAADSQKLFKGADAVCHFAGFVPPDYADASYAAQCYQINAQGTLDLLEVARQAGVMRFLYSSTNLYLARRRLVTEEDALYPSHRAPFYLTSKATGEVFANYYGRTQGMDVTILRLASVYGPGMGAHGIIPLFTRRLRRGEAIQVHNGGLYTADLVYVDDVVRAALAAVDRRSAGIFNVGSGRPISVLDLAYTLAELLEVPAGLIEVEPSRLHEERPGFSALAIAKSQTALDFEPTSLKEGLKMYLARSA